MAYMKKYHIKCQVCCGMDLLINPRLHTIFNVGEGNKVILTDPQGLILLVVECKICGHTLLFNNSFVLKKLEEE